MYKKKFLSYIKIGVSCLRTLKRRKISILPHPKNKYKLTFSVIGKKNFSRMPVLFLMVPENLKEKLTMECKEKVAYEKNLDGSPCRWNE
jgi:hypothetical protein